MTEQETGEVDLEVRAEKASNADLQEPIATVGLGEQ